jgi:hypothetical protein
VSEHLHSRVLGRERETAAIEYSDACDSFPGEPRVKALLLAKTSDHGPYSNKIDRDGCAKGLLESVSKHDTGLVGAFVEAISKRDLLFVAGWQQPDLFAGETL